MHTEFLSDTQRTLDNNDNYIGEKESQLRGS